MLAGQGLPGVARGALVLALLLSLLPRQVTAAGRAAYDGWRNADPDAAWYRPPVGDVPQILEWYQAIYPDRVQVYPIGRSLLGRPIVAARVTSSPRDEASWRRPVFLLTGGHHGNETAPPRVILDYLDHLLDPGRAGDEAYPGASTTHGDLLATRQLWVVPVANPDGYAARTRKNAGGVDLNRDYEGQWLPWLDDEVKSTTGPYPLSQPESWAIDNLLDNLLPTVFLDVHTQMQPMWQTATDFSPGEFFRITGENRTCICDATGEIVCDVFEEVAEEPAIIGQGEPTALVWQGPGQPAGPSPEPPATVRDDRGQITGMFWPGRSFGFQVDPPTPVPLGARFAARPGSNWFIVVNRTRYTWDDDDSGYENNQRRTPGSDVLHLLERRTSNPGLPSKSLPELSELAGRAGRAGPGRRFYAPYSPFDACDTRAVLHRGTGGMSQQVYNHARQKHGALALLLELPRYKVADVFTDSERWVRRPGTNDAGDPGNENRWWDHGDAEADVARINTELFAPFNRLLELAGNPVPSPPSGGFTDTAIVALRSVEDECVTSRVYPAVFDARRGGRSVGIATHGPKRMSCRIANLGNRTAAFQADLTVTDETTGTSVRSERAFENVAAGDTRSFEHPYDFLPGHRYTVSCTLLKHNDSDAGEVRVFGDQGCRTACEAGDCPPECTPASSSTYDRTWRTNNQQRIRFDAVLAPESLCAEGVALPRNVNGYPVGHLPAVVTP